ncbi:MAG: ABC transporter ATP-binding protein, partial [Deltaproteobacteria bacterium]
DVPDGEIFGLVGPNGAGKSTAIKLFLGLIRPTSGSGTIDGHPIGSPESRRRLGFLPENPALYEFLTADEYMALAGSLSGLGKKLIRERTDRLLEQVGLTHARDLAIRKFSKGMVQRLGLAQALIGDPSIVILDEPMSGLDPIGRKDVRDLIFKLRDEGRTVFFSTHILPDVEAICDRVALLSKGRLTDIGRLDDLLSNRVRAVEVTVSGLPGELVERLIKERAARAPGEGRVIVSFPAHDDANRFVAEVVAAKGSIESVNVLRENLEELFMRRAAEASEARR